MLKFSIIGEPTNLNIGIKHKGALRLKINTMGKSAHGSTPQDGINAIYNMEKLINKLRKTLVLDYSKKNNSNLDNPTINIGIINGGTAFNIVPDFCSIEVDRRIIFGETIEYAINEFDSVVQELNEKENDFFAEIEKPLDFIPYLETDKNEIFVKIAHKSALKFAQNSEIVSLPYTTDGGFLSDLKIPTIVLGPGDIKVCHQKGEYISFNQLNLALEIYKDIILNII
jgi:succinyl-diaminopimelate desuccinylase